MTITFAVSGRPQGKQRVRAGANGNFYTPSATRGYEEMIAWAAKAAGAQVSFKPIDLLLTIYYPIPQSWSQGRQREAAYGAVRPTVKPDASNVLKSVEDALNNIAYKDDAQIVSVRIAKFYADDPRIEVCLRELDD